jgi:hypothetical protein
MTRPSVSLVEISRRKTRPSWTAIVTSPGRAQQWARQSRVWQVLGYLALILALLLGAAGLLQLWSQLRPPRPGLSFAPPTQTAVAAMLGQPVEPTPTKRPPDQAAPATFTPSRAPTRTVAPATRAATQAAPATATPAALPSPTSPGTSQWLAFYSTQGESPGLYVMDLNRPEERQALPLPEGYDLASWPAFCGERLAFEAQDRALTLPRWIFLYNLADQSLQPVVLADLDPIRLSAPGCSPNGELLAFSAYLDNDWELILLELDSGRIVYRHKSAAYPWLGHASWALDQETLWWMGSRVNGFYDINRTRGYLDGQPGFTQTFAQGKYPAISPDGSRVAFFCGNLLHLCVAEAKSAEILYQIPVSYFKRVNDQPAPATASWSADGQWLYFTSSITGNWDIYRVRADGSQIQNLTEDWRTDELMPAAR